MPFQQVGAEAWNRVVLASDDGWFWHMRPYADFLLELGAGREVRDLSFALVRDSRVIAACPLYLDENEGVRQLECGGEPVPFPAVIRDLPLTQRKRALGLYVAELERLAKEHAAEYVRIKVPALAATHVGGGLPSQNPMLQFGFLDLPHTTQVIELRKQEDRLWAEVRKGHRYNIRGAQKVCEVVIWDGNSINADIMRRYQALHAKDAGRVTRSQRSFDLMVEWIRSGYAVLFEARNCNQPVAFVLVVLFGGGAYYGSSCIDPDAAEIAAGHLLQWKAITWLKNQGFSHYDIGLQVYGPQWFHVPSEKELGIAKYKRGFGGVTISLHTAEHFYSPDLAKRRIRERSAQLAHSLIFGNSVPS